MSRPLTRRAALQGTAAATLGLAAGVAPILASAAPLHPADTRLVELADALHGVETACDAFLIAHPADEDEAGFIALADGYAPLEAEIAATPAASMAGILAKVRALDVRTSRDSDGDTGIALSVVDDLARLRATGAIHA